MSVLLEICFGGSGDHFDGGFVMNNAICGSGGCSSSAVMGGVQRPDPSRMTEKLFSKLDTKGQGYLEKSDFQNAFNLASSTGISDGPSSVDDVFKALDSDGNGKITKQEMSDSVRNLAEQLGSQLQSMRINANSGSPQDLTNLSQSFAAADSNKDGQVSIQELVAYQKSTELSLPSSEAQGGDSQVMLRIMELAKSYGVSGQDTLSGGSVSVHV